MKLKMKIKVFIDFLMTMLLLLLMAFQITGQEFHEWFGAGMLCLAYSGIVMSRYVFDFVRIRGQMALARQMHMAASYWGFVLMSVHLGLHWGMVVGMVKKRFQGRKLPEALPWVLRIAVVLAAGYGAVCFYKAKNISYMFLQIRFAFFDFERPGTLVFIENIAMMILWVLVGYSVKWCKKSRSNFQRE